MTSLNNTFQAYLLETYSYLDKNSDMFAKVIDIQYWENQNIKTIEEHKHHLLVSEHWDFYKEVNGIRPRFMNYSKMTIAELEAEIEMLQRQADFNDEMEQLAKEQEEKEIKDRIAKNAYKPNLAFANLKDLMSS